MRVAVFVVLVLVVSTPSQASQSCMTKTEARQHFASTHIYWHGPDHCWDATPVRRHQQARKAQLIRKVQRKIDQPDWYESMSQMLPEQQQAQQQQQQAQASPEPQTAPEPQKLLDPQRLLEAGLAKAPWADRWVDIASAQRPAVDIAEVASPPAVVERMPEPMLTARAVVMAFIAIALTIAIVELVFGGIRWPGRRYQRN